MAEEAVVRLLLEWPTADWMFSTTYAAGVPWNDTNWEHEKFNELHSPHCHSAC